MNLIKISRYTSFENPQCFWTFLVDKNLVKITVFRWYGNDKKFNKILVQQSFIKKYFWQEPTTIFLLTTKQSLSSKGAGVKVRVPKHKKWVLRAPRLVPEDTPQYLVSRIRVSMVWVFILSRSEPHCPATGWLRWSCAVSAVRTMSQNHGKWWKTQGFLPLLFFNTLWSF